MASGAGVLIFVPQGKLCTIFMHYFYATLWNSLTCNFPALHFVELSSFNLFLLHIFLPTSLAEDNELTLARYYIPSLTHLRNPHASQATSYQQRTVWRFLVDCIHPPSIPPRCMK